MLNVHNAFKLNPLQKLYPESGHLSPVEHVGVGGGPQHPAQEGHPGQHLDVLQRDAFAASPGEDQGRDVPPLPGPPDLHVRSHDRASRTGTRSFTRSHVMFTTKYLELLQDTAAEYKTLIKAADLLGWAKPNYSTGFIQR